MDVGTELRFDYGGEDMPWRKVRSTFSHYCIFICIFYQNRPQKKQSTVTAAVSYGDVMSCVTPCVTASLATAVTAANTSVIATDAL